MKHICKKSLSLLLVLCMLVSLFAGLSMTAGAEEGTALTFTDGAAAITAGGTYTLAAGSTGMITVSTTDKVTLVGGYALKSDLTEEATSYKFSALSVDCSGTPGAQIELKNMGITGPVSGKDCINFSGTGNVLTITGTNLIDYNTGFNSQSAIHVGTGTALTINGTGTLYLYKAAAGAGFGGNSGELNGDIIFGDSNSTALKIFAKGTKQSALIGAGANANSNDIPGKIVFDYGTYNLMTNSRGACIGGSAGSGGASAGTSVYVRHASVNINVDYTGAAVGGGGYAQGNDSSGGNLYISGGSLRTYIDKNAASSTTTGYNGKPFTEGVNDTAITADRWNSDAADKASVYICSVDTALVSAAASYDVDVDGADFYNGGLHAYHYVNESLEKADQLTISTTPANWAASDDTNLYLYLTGEDHTITVNGTKLNAVWDQAASAFSVVPAPAEYDWTSTTWAGGLDFSWYDENDVKSEYHITTPAQWEAMAWICSERLADLADYKTNTAGNVTAIKGTVPTKQYKFLNCKIYLDNDIDMGGVYTAANASNDTYGWTSEHNYYPVGGSCASDIACTKKTDSNGNIWYGAFWGSFDGQGHVVKNIYCNRLGTSYSDSQMCALFGRVGDPDGAIQGQAGSGAPESDLIIQNVAVTGFINGGRSCGGIVGKTLHMAAGYTVKVENCMNFATVKTNNGAKGVGGVVGALWNGGTVNNCANFGNVIGTYSSANAAGISGAAEAGTSNSYNVGTVTNTAKAANSAAVALNQSAAAEVVNCYALEGSAPGYTTSIANGGKLISGGFKTEAEMKSPAMAVYLNAENAGAWVIPTAADPIYALMSELGVAGYPVPKVFSTSAAPSGQTNVTPTVTDGTASAEISAVTVTENAPFTVSVKTADPTVTKDEVSIPAAALTSLAAAEEFTLEGNVGTISMPAAALSSIVTAAGSQPLSISVETKTAQDVTGVSSADLADAAIVEINISAGSSAITSFGGSAIQISIPAGAKHTVGKQYKVIELSSDGKAKILVGICAEENGVKVLQVETTGLSTFVGTASQPYSVALSVGTNNVVAGNDASVKLTVSRDNTTTYNSYDFTLTYDSTLLTYQSISLANASVDSTTNTGTLRIQGCSTALNCSDPIEITFTTKTKGTAAVTLTAAAVDEQDNANQNAMQATITKAEVSISAKQPAVTVTTTEYADGYTLIKGVYTADGTSGYIPTYDGQPMYKVKKVGTQTFYGTNYYYYVVKTSEYDAAKVSFAKATAETITKDGDVNGTGVIDVNDAQFAHNLYIGAQTAYTPTVKQLLAADVNGDGTVDTLDCAAAIGKITK